MKKYWNKGYGHVTINLLLITIGILGPTLVNVKNQYIIQILLVSSLMFIYTIFTNVNNSDVESAIIQDNPQSRMVESQKIMLELSNSMIEVKSFEELLNIILEKAIEMIPETDQGSILVLNKEGKLEFKAIIGFDKELYKVKLEPEESYQWKATGGVFNGPIIIEDLQKYSNNSMSAGNYTAMNKIDALSFNSSLSAPIMINNQFFGFINLDSKVTRMFNEDDVQIMSYFLNQATIAIVNHQLYEEMLYFSRYDELTKVYNRRYFNEFVEKQLAGKMTSKFSIAIIDLNEFKQVNDLYGHRNGDLVLEKFAEFFSEELDQEDIFARYGGDEFVIMFQNKNYLESKEKISRIIEIISAKKIKLIDTIDFFTYSCSYGIAFYPNEGKILNELLHLADSRMYEYKKEHHKRRCDDI